jgi:hypothetical protein
VTGRPGEKGRALSLPGATQQLSGSEADCNRGVKLEGRVKSDSSGNVYQFDRYFREEKEAISCLMFSNVASLALWAAFLVAKCGALPADTTTLRGSDVMVQFEISARRAGVLDRRKLLLWQRRHPNQKVQLT